MGSQLTNLIKSYLGGVDFYSGVVKGVSFLGVVRERERGQFVRSWLDWARTEGLHLKEEKILCYSILLPSKHQKLKHQSELEEEGHILVSC